MATGLGNEAGYVPVADGGNPRILTGIAASNLSGGTFAYFSGAADAISSGLNSFVTSDVAVLGDASGLDFAGVVLNDTASGNAVAVATRGVIIAKAYGTVTPSRTQVCEGTNAISDGTTAGHVIGRSLSSATSGGYALFDIQG